MKISCSRLIKLLLLLFFDEKTSNFIEMMINLIHIISYKVFLTFQNISIYHQI